MAGDILLAHPGGGDHDDIFLYNVTSAGEGTTTGVKELLIDGDDLAFGGKHIVGLDLLEFDTTIGGTFLAEGNVLLGLLLIPAAHFS